MAFADALAAFKAFDLEAFAKTAPAPWEAAEAELRGKARGAAAPGGTRGAAPWETPPALKQ